MKLSHLGICAALAGAAVFGGVTWLSPRGQPKAALAPDPLNGVVLEVARSFEAMAKAGKDLPVPEPKHLRAPTAPVAPIVGDAPAPAWEDSAAKLGFVDYENELRSYGDSSATSVSLQRLMVINHVGTVGFPAGGREFASEAFIELQARPEETVQSIGVLMDSIPADRAEERSYLLQLATLLDAPGSSSHPEVTALLRDELDRGLAGDAPPEARASAAAAAVGLANLGEPLPDVTSLAKDNARLSQALQRQPAASATGAPAAADPHSYSY